MAESFASRFVASSRAKKTLLVLGMDPDFGRIQRDFAQSPIVLTPDAAKLFNSALGSEEKAFGWLPGETREAYRLFSSFCAQTIFALRDETVGVKFQIAFFEEAGVLGLHVLSALLAFTRELGLLTIIDAKRGDIGSTFKRYLNTYLSATGTPLPLEGDAMTVNPLVGTDTWELFMPYLKRGKGIFLLTYPTAPGAEAIMDAMIDDHPLWWVLGEAANAMVMANGLEDQPSNLGLVMGALRPPMAERIREVFPSGIFLVPGVGAQGGTMANAAAFTGGKNWAMFPVSRALNYSYADSQHDLKTLGSTFWESNLAQARLFNQELRSVLRFE
jgi:orotidine-5'-phosphate decarboxylase